MRCLQVAGGVTVLLAAIVAGFYIKFQQDLSRGLPIPGAPTSFPLGNIHELFGSPNFLEGLETLTKTHADRSTGLASIWQSSQQVISMTHHGDIDHLLASTTERTLPPGIQKIMDHIIGKSSLASLHGSEWNRTRSVVQSAIERASLRGMLRDIFEATDRFSDKLAHANRQMDAVPHIRDLVYEVVGQVTHGRPLRGVNDGTQAAVDLMTQEAVRRVYSPNPLDSIFWLPTQDNTKLNKARDLLRGSIRQEIEQRRKGFRGEHEDFLTHLMEGEMGQPQNGDLDVETLVDTVSSLIFGSTETFSSLFSYALFMLGTRKELQDKVHREAVKAFENFPSTVTSPGDSSSSGSHLPSFNFHDLTYTNLVIKETLRLYPPAPLIQRTVQDPLELQHGKVTLPPGTEVWVPLFFSQRSPENFEAPEQFNPERFLKEVPAGAAIPFSGGRRTCVAGHFAESLATVMLARMVFLAEFTTAWGPMPNPTSNGFTQVPFDGVPIVAKPRQVRLSL